MSLDRSFVKPIQYSKLEFVTVRALFAWIIWITIPPYSSGVMPYANQPAPNGLAKTFGLDFTFLGSPEPWIFDWPAFGFLRALAALALIIYALGFVPWLCLTYVTCFFVSFGTLYNSQGSITHHMQLTSMVLTGITVYHLYHRVRYRKPKPDDPNPFLRSIHVGQLLITGAYVSSAVSKSLKSGFFGWIGKTENFPIALVKAERMHYYNDLTTIDPKNLPVMEAIATRLGDLLTSNPSLGPLIIGPGLIIEAFAFVLLFGRKWSVYGAVLIIIFHMFVGAMMNLHFDSNIILITSFFIVPNILYWLYGRFSGQPLPSSSSRRRKKKAAA